MGYPSEQVLKVLTEEEIKTEAELIKYWDGVKDKLPVKAQEIIPDKLAWPKPPERPTGAWETARRIASKTPLVNLLGDVRQGPTPVRRVRRLSTPSASSRPLF